MFKSGWAVADEESDNGGESFQEFWRKSAVVPSTSIVSFEASSPSCVFQKKDSRKDTGESLEEAHVDSF